MILTHESGTQEDQFDGKKRRPKISWYYPFKRCRVKNTYFPEVHQKTGFWRSWLKNIKIILEVGMTYCLHRKSLNKYRVAAVFWPLFDFFSKNALKRSVLHILTQNFHRLFTGIWGMASAKKNYHHPSLRPRYEAGNTYRPLPWRPSVGWPSPPWSSPSAGWQCCEGLC